MFGPLLLGRPTVWQYHAQIPIPVKYITAAAAAAASTSKQTSQRLRPEADDDRGCEEGFDRCASQVKNALLQTLQETLHEISDWECFTDCWGDNASFTVLISGCCLHRNDVQ